MELSEKESGTLHRRIEQEENLKEVIVEELVFMGYERIEVNGGVGFGFLVFKNEELGIRIQINKVRGSQSWEYHLVFSYDMWKEETIKDYYEHKARFNDERRKKDEVLTHQHEIVPKILAWEGVIQSERIIEQGQQLLGQQN